MNKGSLVTIFALGLSLVFLSCMRLEDQQAYEDRSVSLAKTTHETANILVSFSGSSREERFLGSFDEIKKLTLDILQNLDSEEVISGLPLTKDEITQKWSAKVENMVFNLDYTITGHAYKMSDNGSLLEIFRGNTQHIVTSGNNFISLRLSPLADNQTLSNEDENSTELNTNGRFFSLGDNGIILSSTDGNTWTSRESGTSIPLLGVAYGNRTLVTVGGNVLEKIILSSHDGISWASRNSGLFGLNSDVTYGKGLFVTVGNNFSTGTIQTSTDGKKWTPRESGTSNPLLGVTYANGLYVAVGANGTILTSTDGKKWTSRNSETSLPLLGIVYGNGIFVTVGGNILETIILSSQDGISWTRRKSSFFGLNSDVTYGKGLFVTVGNNFWAGTIRTSTDGKKWTPRESGTSNPLLGVSYANGLYMAVGAKGTILTSTDGEKWTSRNSGISKNIFSAYAHESKAIPGCMNENALNYNWNATEDNGSCIYEDSGSIYPTDWDRHTPGGSSKCSDGSEYSFFTRDADKKRVLFYFVGGGACWSNLTCKTLSTYNSTVSNEGDPGKWNRGIFAMDNKANPFSDWTMIVVPYCTADVHIGNSIGNYAGKLVHHQGRANSQTALDYLLANHSRASEFFVTGSSAGSIGASFYAGVIADQIPDATITLFNDGTGGLATNNSYDLMTTYGANSGIPAWVFEKQWNNRYFSLNKTTSADLVVFNWLNHKKMRFGRFDDSQDVTVTFYNALLNNPNESYKKMIKSSEEIIEKQGIEISGFIAQGTGHTILASQRLYTQETEGVLFLDWFTDFINGGQPDDVHCVDC